MHSKRYEEARKEFKNCILVSPFTLFFSLYNAFHYWKPIMDKELKKEKSGQSQ